MPFLSPNAIEKTVLVPERYRKDFEKQGLRYNDDGAWMPDFTKIEFVTTQPSKQCRECGGVKPDHFKKCYLIKS